MQISQLGELMKSSGIVGAGGAGFPSYAKLSDKADTVILNCAECEPLLKLHRQLMKDYAREIMTAFDEVCNAVGAKNKYIAVKQSYKGTIEAIEANLSAFDGMKVSKLPDAYPSGDEIVLIYEVTKRVVPQGNIPISKGVIVYNVETILNLYNAIEEKKPVYEKFVTIAGEVKNPVTVRVPIGITVEELINLAGGLTDERAVLISGGPMMGKITGMYDVVTKTTNAILALPENNVVVSRKKTNVSVSMKRAMAACCQCRSCSDMCPRHLLGHSIKPHLFMRSASSGVVRDISPMLATMYCSSCGVCEMFACPQGLSPRSLIAEYKGQLRANGVKMPQMEGEDVNEHRELRKVSMSRLINRLGLSKYNVEAPLKETDYQPKTVKIMLNQHIGAPAKAVVSKGETVTAGQLIATVGEAMGAEIHSSVNGKVSEVNDKFIIIKRQGVK